MLIKYCVPRTSIGAPLPPKQAHRASHDIIVHQGNHRVSGLNDIKTKHNLIEIFHFPIRVQEQLINKIAKGGAAYQRNNTLPKNLGITWRVLYDKLQKNGHLNEYIEDNIYNHESLKLGLSDKTIVKDDRLERYLKDIYLED